MTPMHDTMASGEPIAASSAAESPSKSTAFQVTLEAHGSDGAVPDFDTEVTSAPFSAKILHTRVPTKPVPPTTVTFNASDEAESTKTNSDRSIDRRCSAVSARGCRGRELSAEWSAR